MIPCPDRDQLEAFLNNRLGAHEEGPLSLHIESCLRCQAELEQLTSVRQGPGSGPGDPCPADPRKTLPYAPPTAATNQGDTRPTSDILQALGHLIPAGAPTANRAADPLARHGSALPALPGFEVLEEIGRGGMGVVYKARHLRLNRVVAIKMLSRDYADTPDHLVRFHLEAEATARLQHPGVVQIFEFGTHGNQPYVVLEFAEGGSLARRLQGQPLPPHEAARLVKALAETVQAAHDLGIIHRDLKPANVLLGEHGTPKIADFGLAKLLHLDVKLTQSGTMAGTPSYMAPEQVLGQQDRVGPPTDVYALGAILYELITGQPPFLGGSAHDIMSQVNAQEPVRPRRLKPHTPRDLETICLTCLHKDPRRRYPSASELAAELDRFLAGQSIRARRVGAVERAWRWCRRNPMSAVLAGALSLFLVGATVSSLVAAAYFDKLAEKEALTARDERSARLEAEAKSQEANRQRERAEVSLYNDRVAQAHLHYRLNNFAQAERNLRLCLPEPGRPDRRGWEWYYLGGVFHAELASFPGHQVEGRPAWIAALAFSPDGRRLAVGGRAPRYVSTQPGWRADLKVWDLASGQCKCSLGGTDGPVLSIGEVAFSPDGRRLVARSFDPKGINPKQQTVTVLSWDVGTWRICLHREGTYQIDGNRVKIEGNRLAWSSGTQLLFSDLLTGRDVSQVEAPKILGWRCPQNEHDRLLVVLADGELASYEGAQRRTLGRITLPRGEAGVRVLFSPDGRLLALRRDFGNSLEFWDVDKIRFLQSLRGAEIMAWAFSPDGRSFAYGGYGNCVHVLDVEEWQERLLFPGHEAPISALAFSPDGQRLAAGDWHGTVKVWDATRPPEYQPVGSVKQSGTADIALGRSGGRTVLRRILAPNRGKITLESWDADTGEPLGRQEDLDIVGSRRAPTKEQAFDAAGRRLAGIAQSDRRLVKLLDAEDGTERQVFRGHERPVQTVAISPQGGFLASAAWEPSEPMETRVCEVKVWEATSGRAVFTHEGPGGSVGPLALSSNGRLLVGAYQPGGASRPVLLVWDVVNKQQRHRLPGGVGQVEALAFSPTAPHLASHGRDGTVVLHDLETGQPIWTVEAQAELISLAFSPDGHRLAGASRSQVTLWDAMSGQETLTLSIVGSAIGALFNPRVVFNPDGCHLAANHSDGRVFVWRATAAGR